ncbi:hypothetical protein HYY69_03115 [Candidatus Woesearchaeota archaeon]|nr:hypothetical protein [Candidatus Woesearchaeota archaeon]
MERVMLPQSFFLISIIGFLISAMYTYSGTLPLSWGFSFCLIFIIMFVAAVASMTPSAADLKELS